MMDKIEKIKKCNLELKEIDGIKFRIMWGTRTLYSLLYLIIMTIIFISFNDLIIYRSFSLDFHEVALTIFILILFIIYKN